MRTGSVWRPWPSTPSLLWRLSTSTCESTLTTNHFMPTSIRHGKTAALRASSSLSHESNNCKSVTIGASMVRLSNPKRIKSITIHKWPRLQAAHYPYMFSNSSYKLKKIEAEALVFSYEIFRGVTCCRLQNIQNGYLFTSSIWNDFVIKMVHTVCLHVVLII
jgi:hypothetical protein